MNTQIQILRYKINQEMPDGRYLIWQYFYEDKVLVSEKFNMSVE